MSSQGAKTTGAKDAPGFAAGPSAGTPITNGYAFDTDSIRDGSDWIAYKKQLLILNENKARIVQDPWFARGNDYRIQYLLGRSKQPNAGSCTPCNGGAISGGIA